MDIGERRSANDTKWILVKHTGWQGIIRNNYFQGLARAMLSYVQMLNSQG